MKIESDLERAIKQSINDCLSQIENLDKREELRGLIDQLSRISTFHVTCLDMECMKCVTDFVGNLIAQDRVIEFHCHFHK